MMESAVNISVHTVVNNQRRNYGRRKGSDLNVTPLALEAQGKRNGVCRRWHLVRGRGRTKLSTHSGRIQSPRRKEFRHFDRNIKIAI
jgi:hypothetical protein